MRMELRWWEENKINSEWSIWLKKISGIFNNSFKIKKSINFIFKNEVYLFNWHWNRKVHEHLYLSTQNHYILILTINYIVSQSHNCITIQWLNQPIKLYSYIYIYTHMYMCMYACCMYVCMYVSMYVCMYVYIHTLYTINIYVLDDLGCHKIKLGNSYSKWQYEWIMFNLNREKKP